MKTTHMLLAAAIVASAGIVSAQTMTPDAQATSNAAAPNAAAPTTMTPATAADVKAGASVVDATGGAVGTIESVADGNAVLSTGTVRVSLAVASFGKSDRGLVLGMTKAQVEAEAAKAAGGKG